MGKLPPVKRLDTNDFPTEKGWIGNLFYILNDFIRTVYSLFDSGITVADNMKGMIFTIDTVTIGASAPNAAIGIKNTMSVKPYAVLLGWVREKNTVASATTSIITSAVQIDWYYDSGKQQIYIQNVNGLTAAKSYTINLVILGG